MNWPAITIGRVLVAVQYGLSLPTDNSGTIPIVGMKDIKGGKVFIDTAIRVNLTEGQAEAYKLKKGDILLNRTNSPDLVGKTGFVYKDEDAVFASYLVRLTIDRTKADPEYVNYCINSETGQRQIKTLSTRAISQANINPTTFKQHFHIPLPPVTVQKHISATLCTWGLAIEKTERLIEAKEKVFSWLLKRMITSDKHLHRHIRDFTTELSKRNSGGVIDRVLSVTNNRGFVLPEDQFERRVASSDLSNYKVITSDQYAYNPSRINVGSIARLDRWDKGVLSPMYVVFRLNEKKVNNDFFLHWLSSHEAKERIRKGAQGSVRETVSFGDFGAIPFPIPPIEQQQQIASTLNTAQQEIDLLKKQAEAYRKQKRGLLQKLLTGEWQVRTAEEV